MQPFLTRASLVLVALLAPAARAEGPKNRAEEEKALRKRAEEFVAAFNRGDAEALVAFWTEDGDHVDQVGRARKGRQAIGDAYRKLFAASKGAKLNVTRTSLRFLTPDLAITDGFTAVVP